MNISGDAAITGNTLEDGRTKSNVHLTSGKVIQISDNNADTTDDAFTGSIGVTTLTKPTSIGKPIVITSGWKSACTGSIESDHAKYIIDKNTDGEKTLSLAFIVIYESGTYGNSSAYTEATKEHDKPLKLRGVTFIREGYTQTSWSTTKDGNTVYVFDAIYTDNKDLTLYPVWKANTTAITLDTTDATNTPTASITATYDSAISITTLPVRTGGYGFDGFYTAASNGVKVINADGTLVQNVAGYTSNNTSPVWRYMGESPLTLYVQWAEKTVVSITQAQQTAEYDGNSKSFKILGTTLTDGFTVEYQLGTAEFTTTPPTVVGSYNVRITRAETETHKAFSATISNGLVISAKEIVITWIADDFTYNGADQKTKITATYLDISNEAVSLTISLEGEFKNYKDGGYTFSASLPSGEINYKLPSDANKTYNMKKAALTVTANDHSIIYGNAPSNNGVAYSGFVTEENSANLTGTLAYDYAYTQYGQVGSTYTITPKGLTGDNYSISFVVGKLRVTAKEITVTITPNGGVYGSVTAASAGD